MRKVYKMFDEKMCVSTQELCNQMNISRKTISEWETKGCPKQARGWWPIWEVLRWRGLIDGGGVNTAEEADESSFAIKKLKYEAEYKKQKAEEAAFENAVTRGEYIKKDDIIAELQRFFIVLKRSLLGYSRTISTELAAYVDSVTARRIERMITELTMDALEQICIDGIYKPSKRKKKDKK